MAAVAACARVCEERGWKLGEQAGYQGSLRIPRWPANPAHLSHGRPVTAPNDRRSRVERRWPVIIDEFHERNLNQDLVLGAIREIQMLGRDLKLMVMSATLDAGRLVSFLPGAQMVDVPGSVFPLDIRYATKPLRLQTDGEFYGRVANAAVSAARETSGDVLIFLPGTGEIARMEERLAGVTDPGDRAFARFSASGGAAEGAATANEAALYPRYERR